MTGQPFPEQPSSDDGRADRARAQEDRATEAITAIFSGADLVDESMKLANEFTDSQTSRFASWLGKRRS